MVIGSILPRRVRLAPEVVVCALKALSEPSVVNALVFTSAMVVTTKTSLFVPMMRACVPGIAPKAFAV